MEPIWLLFIFYGGSVMNNEKKENKVIEWIKAYKKQILKAALITGGAVLTIAGIKKLAKPKNSNYSIYWVRRNNKADAQIKVPDCTYETLKAWKDIAKGGKEAVGAALGNVPISDLGKVGEELCKSEEVNKDCLVDLVLTTGAQNWNEK